MLCLTLVLWTMLATLSAALPTTNVTTTDLVDTLSKRQCIWDAKTSEWECDVMIPTVPEIVARLQDKDNNGKAVEGARAAFYTNIVTGKRTPEKAREAYGWCLSWLEANGVSSYYIAIAAVDPGWYNAQET
jgi:hypothetical protein